MYDLDKGLREVAAMRANPNPLLTETARVAERMADGFRREFGHLDLDTCGRALIIAAATIVPLCDGRTPPGVLANLLAFAGESLAQDVNRG